MAAKREKQERPVIVWFRQDLRLSDNPAFHEAVRTGSPILPVFILDDVNPGAWIPGAASQWWLHQSLQSLDNRLHGRMVFRRGSSDKLLPELARRVGATAVFANSCAEPWQRSCDKRVRASLTADRITFSVRSGADLFDPDKVRKADGSPYRVFTPYYRRGCLRSAEGPRIPLPAPSDFRTCEHALDGGLDDLQLMPEIDWYSRLADHWFVGEEGARLRLEHFLDNGLRGYREGRNRPDQQHVSRLSPHLHFGEISPHQVWHAVQTLLANPDLAGDVDTFMAELGWREFSRYLLWHWPELPDENLQSKFDRFPWGEDQELLERWQTGHTGLPIVDAGMRELWQTGYMHNRVRMIVGSFLVKNLLLDWRHGERWFWDTLVDADLASNSASWQWVAGSGADAAPYFRIFNPVTQGERFDPDGSYVRRFVPELRELPASEIHKPWTNGALLNSAHRYPEPVVDLKASREQALAAFRSLS